VVGYAISPAVLPGEVSLVLQFIKGKTKCSSNHSHFFSVCSIGEIISTVEHEIQSELFVLKIKL
jgi:hypothetical protein